MMKNAFSQSLIYTLGLVCFFFVPQNRVSSQEDAPPDEQVRPYDLIIFNNASGREESMRCIVQAQSESTVVIDRINDDGKSVGEFRLKRTDVKEIVPKQDADTVFITKTKKLPKANSPFEEQAKAVFDLAVWARTPLLENSGDPPKPAEAYKLLLKAARLQPSLIEVYPHLFDEVAQRKQTTNLSNDEEMEIFLLAKKGGYKSKELSFQLGEKYLELGDEQKARQMFNDVLADEGPANQSFDSRSRRYLAEIHILEGEVDKALALFALSNSNANPFESHFLTARLLLLSKGDTEKARDHLKKAQELQPDFSGIDIQLAGLDLLEGKVQTAAGRLSRKLSSAGEDISLLNALALVNLERGEFTQAVKNLQSATKLSTSTQPSPQRCELYLVRGLLRDYLSDPAKAVNEYKTAWESAPWNRSSGLKIYSGLLYARSSFINGDTTTARTTLEKLIETSGDDPAIFVASARLLADVELKDGKLDRALSLLDHAVRFQGKDAKLRAKYASVLMSDGRLDAAYKQLTEAEKIDGTRPDVLCSLGFYHYSRGELVQAEQAFQKALKTLPSKPIKNPTETEKQQEQWRVYAQQGLNKVLDVKRLEIWEDGFDREDTSEILRGWFKVDNFGVLISLAGEKVEFRGAQKTELKAATQIYREELKKNFERVSVRLKIPNDSKARIGLRIMTDPKDVSVGMALVRDHNGLITFATKASRGEWVMGKKTDPKALQGSYTAKRTTIFRADTNWPTDGEFHTITIAKANSKKGERGFHLYFDDKEIARNVYVSGLTSRSTRPMYFSVFAQAEAIDGEVEFTADDFRLYRVRAQYQGK